MRRVFFVFALLCGSALAQKSIAHVIYFVQENHSFDNYFATFPGAAGSTTWHDHSNAAHTLTHQDATLLYGDCPHNNTDILVVMNVSGGVNQMNGWDLITADGTHICGQSGSSGGGVTANTNGTNTGYYDGGDIPRYWRYAYNYGLADHFFSGIYPSKCGHQAIAGDEDECTNQPGAATQSDLQYSQWGCGHSYGQGGTTTNGQWGVCVGGSNVGGLCKANAGCAGGGTCTFPSSHPFIYDTTNENLYPTISGEAPMWGTALAGSPSGLTTGTTYGSGRCGPTAAAPNIGSKCYCPATPSQNLSGGVTVTGSGFTGTSCIDATDCGNSTAACNLVANIGGSAGGICPEGTNNIFALMDTAGVSWAMYAPPIGVSGFEWNLLQFFASEYFSSDYANNLRLLSNLNSDMQSCNLPTISIITPTIQNSEHPPADVRTGEKFVAGAIDALAANPACWNSSIAFVVWDDHGGLEDHIASPVLDAIHLGPRVPFLCIGWACKNTVTSTQLEFASVLSWLETQFNLCGSPPGCLGGRDGTANSISGMIDTMQSPIAPPTRMKVSGSVSGSF